LGYRVFEQAEAFLYSSFGQKHWLCMIFDFRVHFGFVVLKNTRTKLL